MSMKKILRKYIKRKMFEFAVCAGLPSVSQYVDYITDAPVWQWRKRLWLVKTAINYCCTPSDFDEWLRFLDE